MKSNSTASPKLPGIVKSSPEASAIISKLNKTADSSDKSSIADYVGNTDAISQDTLSKINNNDSIVELFPDIDLAMQIMVSSIISPNDMISTTLSYSSDDLAIPSDLKNSLIGTISKYIKKEHKLEDKLYDMVKEALYTKGAYIEAIIPESSLDEIINKKIYDQYKEKNNMSIESIMDNIVSGKYSVAPEISSNISVETMYNNKPSTITVESNDLLFDIVDNPTFLTSSDKLTRVIEDTINNKYGRSLSVEDNSIDLNNLFKLSNNEQVNVVTVNDENETVRSSLTRPLIHKLPVESVIPVHVISDVSKHVGYFVLLDGNGVPVSGSNAGADDINSQLQNMMNGGNTQSSLITKASSALHNITKNDLKLEMLEDIYSEIITKKIKRSLEAGAYGNLVDINKNSDIYKLMLYRTLKQQKTRLLFLPNKLVSYFAFNYRDNGTGKSLLEGSAMLFSIRAILLFTGIMANLRNSITTTEIKADLGDKDINQKQTMEKIISESLKTRRTAMPWGATKIDDLVDWSYKVGFKYQFTGKGLPDLTIETADTGTNKIVPDDVLSEKIQDLILMSMGITPDLVKSGNDPDFATTIVTRNILMTKRIVALQNKLSAMITSHVRRLIANDAIIMREIEVLIENNMTNIRAYITKLRKNNVSADMSSISNSNIKTYIANEFINNLAITLPRPNTEEFSSSKTTFEAFKSAVDEYLEYIYSDSNLPESLSGALSGKLEDIKAIVRVSLVKKWMADNNYLPEVSDFLIFDEEDIPNVDIGNDYIVHLKSLGKVLTRFYKDDTKAKKELDKKLNKFEDETEPVIDEEPLSEEPTEEPADDKLTLDEDIPDAGDELDLDVGVDEPIEEDMVDVPDEAEDDVFVNEEEPELDEEIK